MRIRVLAVVAATAIFGGCASGPPDVPYPAFIQVDELSDIFMATLPGVRAKQLAGDAATRRTSNRIDLPRDWRGTSGGAPGRSMEIFVLKGELNVADIRLGPRGYAFLPAGSLGFNLTSSAGAQILYFLNDTDPESIIRSPIIIDSDLLRWAPTATSGVSVKELRFDPGNGSKTWLQRISAGASLPWEYSTALREGYLMSGDFRQSECVNGEALTGQYMAGGYFYRPAHSISGGPESMAISDSIWILRETELGVTISVLDCVAAEVTE